MHVRFKQLVRYFYAGECQSRTCANFSSNAAEGRLDMDRSEMRKLYSPLHAECATRGMWVQPLPTGLARRVLRFRTKWGVSVSPTPPRLPYRSPHHPMTVVPGLQANSSLVTPRSVDHPKLMNWLSSPLELVPLSALPGSVPRSSWLRHLAQSSQVTHARRLLSFGLVCLPFQLS